MSGSTPGPLEVRAVLSENRLELCAATIHDPCGVEVGCTWRRQDDPPGSPSLPGVENALLWATAPELADALKALYGDIMLQVHGKRAPGHQDHIRAAGEVLRKIGRLP